MISTKKSFIDPSNLPSVNRSVLRRILTYLVCYRPQLALVVAIVGVTSLLNLFPALLLKAIVDHLQGVLDHSAGPRPRLLFLLCAGLVAAPLVANLLGAAQKYLATLVGERVMFDLRQQLFQHLHRLPLRHFVNARPGEIVSSALNDVQGTGSVLSVTLVGIVENAVGLAATTMVLAWLDWRLALIAVALLPLFVIPTRRAGHQRKGLRRAAQACLAELTGILVETLSASGARAIRLFGTERFEQARLDAKATEALELSVKQTLAGRQFKVLIAIVESLGPALVFSVGGYFILSGRVHNLGTLVAFAAALKRLYGPATSLAGVHVDLVTSYAYFERVFRVLDQAPAIDDTRCSVRLPKVRGEIVLDRVAFAFSDGSHGLTDVSLHIEAGQSVAIVGPSGSGKTTLAGLIPRLDDPTTGRVLLDGHDLRTLDVGWLRARVGVVTQETFLFHASILDNLRYGRPDATAAQVKAAARAACIDELIESLPRGYDTIVGDRGHRLSGGERQRIAIARVILKDPEILILDEATSSLDSVNEGLIQDALEALPRGRTTLVIAHRFSAVTRVDQIVVLERGLVVECGTHHRLLAQRGRYAQLYSRQFDAATPTTVEHCA